MIRNGLGIYAQRTVINDIVENLMNAGLIEESTSDYSSPAILVKKPNNEFRLCIDYRKLNKKIKKIQYPMPIIEEVLGKLANNNYFAKLDLASGYYQIPIRYLTSFSTNEGQYQFKFMPFELVTAPAVFAKSQSTLFTMWMTS